MRLAASLGERVLVDDMSVAATAPVVQPPSKWRLPSRASVERAAGWFFLAVVATGLWGASLCVAALWAWSRGACQLL